MSVNVEISNTENLRTLRQILGVKKDSEAVEISIERTIRTYESTQESNGFEHSGKDGVNNLPDEFWEDLFSSPQLPKGRAVQAVLDDREEARY